MGVYIFEAKHGPFVKVGHYHRQNPWSRVAHRGFHSCICPKALKGRVDCADLKLVAWFPTLGRRQETSVKKHYKRLVGEWYAAKDLEHIVRLLSAYETNQAPSCDKAAALKTRRLL